jgi:hypothetical protein
LHQIPMHLPRKTGPPLHPSSRRKPGSIAEQRDAVNWIPAFAGMTIKDAGGISISMAVRCGALESRRRLMERRHGPKIAGQEADWDRFLGMVSSQRTVEPRAADHCRLLTAV